MRSVREGTPSDNTPPHYEVYVPKIPSGEKFYEPDFTGGDFLCFLNTKVTKRVRESEHSDKTLPCGAAYVPWIHSGKEY